MENTTQPQTIPTTYWKKSWIAYVGELFSCVWAFLFFFVLVFIVIVVLELLGVLNSLGILEALHLKVMQFSDATRLAVYCAAVLTAIAFVLRVIWLATFRLYYDEDGIWVSSGIFPWTKGIYGIKWRDLDEASYQTGFISWLTHSYHTRLGHRFTKASEMTPSQIANGDKFVMEVNQILMDFVRHNEIND